MTEPLAPDRRWLLGGLVLTADAVATWLVLTVLLVVQPADGWTSSPLERVLTAPMLAVVFGTMILWPGVLTAAVVQALVHGRCPMGVQGAATTLLAAAALLAWSVLGGVHPDGATALGAGAVALGWALVGLAVARLVHRAEDGPALSRRGGSRGPARSRCRGASTRGRRRTRAR